MPLAKPPRATYGSFNKVTTATIIEHVGNGIPFTISCQAAGVHYATATRWRSRGERALEKERDTGEPVPDKEYPFVKFMLDLAAARGQAVIRRVGQIDLSAEGGQWQASAWWLERQLPEEFSRVDRTELTGQGGGPIQIGQAEIVQQANEIVARNQQRALTERSENE